ncbi:hypothetical protein J4E08_17805 [Sagittula sp. NFXS13]|uniref:Uncharacterized protein n=1 Tax=Sagittula marina TaxID=943940 RepID=A0A7W6GSC5_9RHOB|nr:hypothetical protein [Sagittula marina]MBB3986311.1 hypothetical protein [Sagittula marina]
MKRFMTATALVTVIATGAFAADDFSTTTINQYIPELDVSTLTDEQAAALVGIATSADEAEKEQKMRSYIGVFKEPETTTVVKVVPADSVVVTEEVAAEDDGEYFDEVIASFLPDVDIETLTDEQKAALVAIASKEGNDNDKEREMRSYLMN